MRFPFSSYDKLYPREPKVVINPDTIEKMVETTEISDENTESTDEINDTVDETTETNGGVNGD